MAAPPLEIARLPRARVLLVSSLSHSPTPIAGMGIRDSSIGVRFSADTLEASYEFSLTFGRIGASRGGA